MILFIILIVVFVFGTWLAVTEISNFDRDWLGMLGLCVALLTGITLAIAFINPIVVGGQIAEYYSVRDSIAISRNSNDIERAALIQKIIDTNKWLASNQYYNKHGFDIFIPDEIDKLEPLR